MLQSTNPTHQFIHSAKSYMKHLLLAIAFLFLTFSPLHSQEKWRKLTADDGLSSDVINEIYQAKNGYIWIGTDKGVNRYNGVFERFRHVQYAPVSVIFESPTGELIARLDKPPGPQGSGLAAVSRVHVFDGLEWEIVKLFNDFDFPLSELSEFAIEFDGKLWIATRNGLIEFDGQKWQLYDPDISVDWLVKTPNGQFWSILWVGQPGDLTEGIASFDGQKWQLEFKTDNSLLDDAKTNTALVTSTGQILLGTDQGLFQYDPNLQQISDLALGRVNVSSMLNTSDNSIWTCVTNEKGKQSLYRLNNGKWESHLPDQAITILYESPHNELWAGGARGLYLFDGEQWHLKLKSTDQINCIYQLPDGTILVGSNSGLWIEVNIDLSEVTVEQSSLFVPGLFQASNGVIWCRSDQGVLSYDGKSWTRHGLDSGVWTMTGLRIKG